MNDSQALSPDPVSLIRPLHKLALPDQGQIEAVRVRIENNLFLDRARWYVQDVWLLLSVLDRIQHQLEVSPVLDLSVVRRALLHAHRDRMNASDLMGGKNGSELGKGYWEEAESYWAAAQEIERVYGKP